MSPTPTRSHSQTGTEYVNDPLSLEVVGTSLNSVAEILGPSDTTENDYYYGLGAAAESGPGGQISYIEADAYGNVTAITDPAGATSSAYLYEPFGSTLQSSSADVGNLTFGGAFGLITEQDDISVVRSRTYSLTLGRFLERDQVGLFGGLGPVRA